MTVIIPHYGDDALLTACLASLDTEDVIVWDGNEENFGFAGNCNRAAAQATGDVLVFLNNDTIAHPGWLGPLEDALDLYPIAGSLLLYPDGRIQHSGVSILRYPNGTLEARNLTYPHPSGEVAAVTGACLAIRRDLFDALGGFDEGFVNGYEDVDLCLRATDATGMRCWYAAESKLTHLESQSGAERWTHVRQNVDRLNQKWGER